MSYRIKGKNGLPIKKDGQFLMGYDIPEVKIEQLDEKNLSFWATGSTEDEDRDKDIVRVAGWQLGNFKKNPVLPWSHNYYEPPLGKAISIKKDKNKKKLIFKAQFDSDDPKAVAVFNKYKNGYLSTFSVGFIGIDFNWRDEENRWYGGKEFTKQELLEISPVTVPANPNANMDIRSIADDLPPSLDSMGYKSFMCKTESGLFIPISDTEIYTSLHVSDVAKGVKGIFGSVIDNPEAEMELVGYQFNADATEEFAKNWVDENGVSNSKIKFFDMAGKQICETDFDLEVIEEVIDSGSKSVEEETEEKDVEESNVEEGEEFVDSIEVEEKDDTEETEEKEIESDQEEVEEKDIEETEETEEKEIETPEETEEIETPEEKEIDETEETEEKTTIDVDEVANKVFDKIKALLIDNKNLVEKENEMNDTENVNSDTELELEDEAETSKSNEIVELDFSLSSPVNEKDNSEDFFELDDDALQTISLQFGCDSSLETIKNGLEKAIKEAMAEFSGRLTD